MSLEIQSNDEKRLGDLIRILTTVGTCFSAALHSIASVYIMSERILLQRYVSDEDERRVQTKPTDELELLLEGLEVEEDVHHLHGTSLASKYVYHCDLSYR
jgi:hypothetical protein